MIMFKDQVLLGSEGKFLMWPVWLALNISEITNYIFLHIILTYLFVNG